MIPSGNVPRTLCPGVEWDERAELRYIELTRQFRAKGMTGADAGREARWAVEIALHQAFVKRLVIQGCECRTDEAKRAVFVEWRTRYGLEVAQSIAGIIKHDALREKVVKSW